MSYPCRSFVHVRPFTGDEVTICPEDSPVPREVLSWNGSDTITVLDPQNGFAPRRNGTFGGLSVLWSVKDDEAKKIVSTPKDVYEKVVVPTIPTIVDGYNVAFMIAGAAGSGRVYTLYGEDVDGPNRGILPRFTEDIFDAFARQMNEDSVLSAEVEAVDISGETYVDCLAVRRMRNGLSSDPELKIAPGGRLQGCTSVELKGSEDARAIIKQLARSVGNRNTTHTVMFRFTETFRFDDPANFGQPVLKSRRVRVLFVLLRNTPPALQRCVDVAVERDSGENPLAKVPTRETALTKLFPELLQQGYYLNVISCISPYYEHAREDFNTLQFSLKCKRLVGNPLLNQDESLMDMRRLADEVKGLKLQARKQSQAMQVVQNEMNAREVELMKQEADHNKATKSIQSVQIELKLATIGRNMEAERTRVFRKETDSALKKQRKAMLATQNNATEKDAARMKLLQDTDDIKARVASIEEKVRKQQANTQIYRDRLEKYQAEKDEVELQEAFNFATPDEQERILSEKLSASCIDARKNIHLVEQEIAALKMPTPRDVPIQALQADYDRAYEEAMPIREKQELLREIAELEMNIAAAEAETRRLQGEMDQKKAACACVVM